jgi:phi13 family phage major tail protein
MDNNPATGLSKLRYAVMQSDGAGDVAPEYGTIYTLPDAITMNFTPNSGRTPLFTDNGLSYIGVTPLGEGTLSLEVADLTPEHEARLLGNSYASGISVLKTSDKPAYVAIGGEVLLDSGASGYVWFYKVKFSLPSSEDKTQGASIEYRTKTMEGSTAKICSIANAGAVRIKTRTDDPAVTPSFLTGFFTTIPFATSDIGAVTVTAAEGTAGDAKKIIFTFAKAGGGSFAIDDTTVAAAIGRLACFVLGALKAGTFTASTTGVAPVIKFTPTVPFTSAQVVTVTAGTLVKDVNGVSLTAYSTAVTIA